MRKEEVKPKDWRDKEVTVTLTGREWNLLEDYLLLSAGYREGELDYYETHSKRTDRYGSLEIKNFTDRAMFWKRICQEIPMIRGKIHAAQ